MCIKSTVLLALVAVPLNYVEAKDNIISIYQQAIEFDPTVKAARFQLEMTEAQRAQAGSVLLPQVNASANISSNEQLSTSTSPTNNYRGERYTVSLTQTIFDTFKLLNWERFHNIVEQQQANQTDALQTLMYNVVERYFKALEYIDAFNLVDQEITTAKKQLEQMRRRFEKQVVKVTDVYELEAKVDKLEADKIAVSTQIDIAKQSIIELTGNKITYLSPLGDTVKFDPLQENIDSLIEKAKVLNPSVIAQQKSIAAAETNVDQQKSRHLPTIDAQANYNNSNYGYQNTQSSAAEVRTIGINVNVPLFSGGGITHAIDEASKNLELNKQKQQSLLGSLNKNIYDAFLSANSSVQRIYAAEKSLRSATKAREAIEKGFQYNMQTISDVLLSQDREFQAKHDILQAKYEYIRQRSRIELFTGQIDEQYLVLVNKWLQ